MKIAGRMTQGEKTMANINHNEKELREKMFKRTEWRVPI